MAGSNKQKRALRIRQKIADRQPSKASQIRRLLKELDTYEEKLIYPKLRSNGE